MKENRFNKSCSQEIEKDKNSWPKKDKQFVNSQLNSNELTIPLNKQQ